MTLFSPGLFFVALLLTATMDLPSAAAESRPNVVIFLADDAGWGDYSRNGNRQVATPHIDSIAVAGVTLDRFYVCPVCAPTRAEFLTGRYHPQTGVYGVSTGQERMNLDERTVVEAFRQAGYATGAFGKWHNGSQWPYHPLARGFQEYYGYTSGHWGEYFDPPLEHNGKPVRDKGYIVDLCTNKALDFIERNKQQPFFCYVPFTTPHSPWAVPDQYWQRFKDKPIAQRGTNPQQEDLNETRCALAMLENQDDNVGRVLKKLDDLQLAENTIVLYFSDNGPNTPRWTGGMKGRKGTTDEGGVRSACFIRWPAKLPKDRTVKEIAGAIDLLPTLLALAGVERVGDKPLDGMDLSPLLFGTRQDWPARMIYSTWGKSASVRTQQYRLDNQGQLFDMVADPGQTKPVNDQVPAVAARLSGSLNQWRKRMALESLGERAPGKSVDPRPIPVGYREFPRTWLPARDAEPQGEIKRSASAPNSSYFVNWKRPTDAIVWEVEVQTAGKYDVELLYTCPAVSAGARIELAHLTSKLSGRVDPAWDPPLYSNQDTIPRPLAESKMKEFKPLRLGTIELKAGRGPLTLRATEIPGSEVMHLLEVTLTLRE